MKKPNTVHCFFEQSGTFKNAFRKLGIKAFDYDLENRFNQTDCQIDLFQEIDNAWNNRLSIFDNISSQDLIFAFFPCTYFSSCQNMFYTLTARQYGGISKLDSIGKAITRLQHRNHFHQTLYKFLGVCLNRNIPLIIENPAQGRNYLFDNNFPPPTFIDWDRRVNGDYSRKPTAYWFFNCKPCLTIDCCTRPTRISKIKSRRGFSRSLISFEYAYNFVAQKVLGLYLASPGSLIQGDFFT